MPKATARRLVHYRLPPEVLAALEAQAAEARTSKTALVEEALRARLRLQESTAKRKDGAK